MEETVFVTQDICATKGQRFSNYIVDLIVQYGISFGIGILAYLLSEWTGAYALERWINSMNIIEEYLLGYGIVLIYYTLIEGITGRSLGKYITGTKVVMGNGEKPGFSDVLARSLGRLIPFEAFSFLGDSGRGWHDTLSKTYVVDVKKFKAKKELKSEIDLIGQE